METYATIYQLRTSWSESNKENLITGGHKGTKVVDTNTTQSSEIVITPLSPRFVKITLRLRLIIITKFRKTTKLNSKQCVRLVFKNKYQDKTDTILSLMELLSLVQK